MIEIEVEYPVKRTKNMSKLTINISGKTEDNKQIISGVLKYIETHGITLDVILQQLESKDIIIDWIDFYETALKCNWQVRTIFTRIETTLLDVKGKDYSNEVMLRLYHYLNKKHSHENQVESALQKGTEQYSKDLKELSDK